MKQTTKVTACTECGRRMNATRTATTDSGTRFHVHECECGNTGKAPAFAPDIIGAMNGFTELTIDGQKTLRENVKDAGGA